MPVDRQELREAIQRVYSDVAHDPKKGYHFHTGPEYAVERLGYSPAALAELPGSVTAPFAGVGNPLALRVPGPAKRSSTSARVAGRTASSPRRRSGPPAGSSPST